MIMKGMGIIASSVNSQFIHSMSRKMPMSVNTLITMSWNPDDKRAHALCVACHARHDTARAQGVVEIERQQLEVLK